MGRELKSLLAQVSEEEAGISKLENNFLQDDKEHKDNGDDEDDEHNDDAQGRKEQSTRRYEARDLKTVNGKGVEVQTGNLANGLLCEYYHNGKAHYEIPLKDGVVEGIQKSYYENGNLSAELPHKDGEAEGIQRTYYSSTGALMGKIPWKKGKIEGYLQLYHRNGRLRARILYRNDEPVSGTYDGRVLTSEQFYKTEKGHYIIMDDLIPLP
jgi:antitoxin component YwqK of YwqJK toxin-antitoxin module